ncbi:amidohydrolase [Streptomyces sp. HC44]|uniref:Amidohydrolase n=1 Tax=Streptomyces scabichelini TaxID=2711217 RepID=A0A6G4VCN2_9ACTN|nr:amidohydrolase family protein [Streptomyces scabichelini]NGO11590.1 amidohydrolase [Streptomyces scabichelini]
MTLDDRTATDGTSVRLSAIDMCALVYDRECWGAYFRDLGGQAPAYLRAFGRHMATVFGADFTLYRRHLNAGDLDAAIEILVAHQPAELDVAAHLRAMDAEGIAYQVLMGSSARLPDGGCVNERVAAFAARAPDRMQAWAGLNLSDPHAALEELERCHALGMRGVTVIAFRDGVEPQLPYYDAVFTAAERLGLPVWLHTGHHLCTSRPNELSHPRIIDVLAGRHPGLRIVAGHGGWPWMPEMISVAQRHPNVRVEFSTHRPSWMAQPGSGWEPLLLYGRGTLRRKVMFGTATWVHSVSPRTLIQEVADLGLGPSVTHDWLRGNAARLLGLEDGEVRTPKTAAPTAAQP